MGGGHRGLLMASCIRCATRDIQLTTALTLHASSFQRHLLAPGRCAEINRSLQVGVRTAQDRGSHALLLQLLLVRYYLHDLPCKVYPVAAPWFAHLAGALQPARVGGPMRSPTTSSFHNKDMENVSIPSHPVQRPSALILQAQSRASGPYAQSPHLQIAP